MKTNLTPRELRVLTLGGTVLVLTLIYFGVDAVVKSYDDLGGQLQAEQEEWKKLVHLRNQYRLTHDRLEAIRDQLGQAEKGFSPVSFIEDLATKEEIRGNMGSAKQKTVPLGEDYKEDLVEIELTDISLAKLVNFIHKVENSGHLLRVKRLKVKTRYDNRSLLNVTMQVSTYSKKS